MLKSSYPSAYPALPCKVLSVKPFSAWAIIHGGKDVENRSFRTRHRGRVLIHASNYRSRAELEDDASYVRDLCPDMPDEVDSAGIIGSVEIMDCVEDNTSQWAEDGCFHWLLAKPRALPFFECKGWLNVWTLKG
jgi:hypothetical protein